MLRPKGLVLLFTVLVITVTAYDLYHCAAIQAMQGALVGMGIGLARYGIDRLSFATVEEYLDLEVMATLRPADVPAILIALVAALLIVNRGDYVIGMFLFIFITNEVTSAICWLVRKRAENSNHNRQSTD